MKIYLAAGFSITNIKGRERQLSQKFERWHRLHSFFFLKELYNSDILNIKKDENLLSIRRSGQ